MPVEHRRPIRQAEHDRLRAAGEGERDGGPPDFGHRRGRVFGPGSGFDVGVDLRTGSVLLSSSRATKNQAFRFKTRLFGFQYHIEWTPSDIEAVTAAYREDVHKVLGTDGERKIREDTAKYYPRYARLGDRILANFVQFLKVY